MRSGRSRTRAGAGASHAFGGGARRAFLPRVTSARGLRICQHEGFDNPDVAIHNTNTKLPKPSDTEVSEPVETEVFTAGSRVRGGNSRHRLCRLRGPQLREDGEGGRVRCLFDDAGPGRQKGQVRSTSHPPRGRSAVRHGPKLRSEVGTLGQSLRIVSVSIPAWLTEHEVQTGMQTPLAALQHRDFLVPEAASHSVACRRAKPSSSATLSTARPSRPGGQARPSAGRRRADQRGSRFSFSVRAALACIAETGPVRAGSALSSPGRLWERIRPDEESRNSGFRRPRVRGNCVFQKDVFFGALRENAALPAVPWWGRSGIRAFVQRDGSRLWRSQQNPPQPCRTEHVRAQDKEPPRAQPAARCSGTVVSEQRALVPAARELSAPPPGPTPPRVSEIVRHFSGRRGSRPRLARRERSRHCSHRLISQKGPSRASPPSGQCGSTFRRRSLARQPRHCSHSSFPQETVLGATALQPQPLFARKATPGTALGRPLAAFRATSTIGFQAQVGEGQKSRPAREGKGLSERHDRVGGSLRAGASYLESEGEEGLGRGRAAQFGPPLPLSRHPTGSPTPSKEVSDVSVKRISARNSPRHCPADLVAGVPAQTRTKPRLWTQCSQSSAEPRRSHPSLSSVLRQELRAPAQSF